MLIKNVLVPIDFSVPSRMAVNFGVALARKFRARVTLLHVLPLPPSPDAEQPLCEDALSELGSLLPPEDEDDLDLRVVVKAGSIQEEIVATVKEQSTDIVVLGTHGRSGLGRLVIGSTTAGLLRKLAIPMITVSRAVRPLGFKRILFATDFGDASAQGFNFALDLARELHSGILVIHVVNELRNRDIALQESQRRLVSLVAEGKAYGVDVQTIRVEGPPAKEILKAAVETGADLLLLTIEHKSAFERAVAGSTADKVVREARVPVLCVPSQFHARPESPIGCQSVAGRGQE